MAWKLFGKRRAPRRPRSGCRRLLVERLEERCLLSGSGLDTLPAFTPPARFGSTEAFTEYFFQETHRRYGSLFGQPWSPWYYLEGPGLLAGQEGTATTPAEGPSHSGTTVQEVGVDEADLVKTDGNFIYLLSGQQLVILNAHPADSLSVASRTNIQGQPIAEYLVGNSLVVLSQVYNFVAYPVFETGGGAP